VLGFDAHYEVMVEVVTWTAAMEMGVAGVVEVDVAEVLEFGTIGLIVAELIVDESEELQLAAAVVD